MRGSALLLSMLVVLGVPLAALSAPESDTEVAARKAALDLAGRFANDGFKMRDGHWSGTIKAHEHTLVAVNLYAGNQYWFSVAAADPAKKISVNLYDETGEQLGESKVERLEVQTESYPAGERAAAKFSPTSSGQDDVLVDLEEGNESSVCLVYSYK